MARKKKSSNTAIPAGYRLTVTSWENDADHYQTTVKEGLSRQQVEFYVGFIKLFRSRHSRQEPKSFGNMYSPSDSELDEAMTAITGYLLSHGDVLRAELEEEPGTPLTAEDLTDFIHDLHREFLGDSGENFVYRVMDSFKVEFVPTVVELHDVTGEFN